MEKLDELFRAHIKQCIKINPTERELLERPLLRLKARSSGLIHIRLQTNGKMKIMTMNAQTKEEQANQ